MGMQDFQLKDIPQRKIFYVACRGPWRQLPEMLSSLFGHTAQGAVRTIGPPGAFYYNTPQEVDAQDLAWEVFYPVNLDTPESINEETGFGVRVIEEARVATTTHQGSYRKAASSYERLHDWINTQGLKTCGPAEEVYLTDINKTNGEQRIEIRLPVCISDISG